MMKPAVNLQTLADQLLLQHFSPPAVLTNDKGECGRLLKQHGVARAPLEQAIAAVRGARLPDP